MLYEISELYVEPDQTTQVLLTSGKAHINGQFLQPNVPQLLPSGFLIQVTIIQSAQLEFTPEPAVKFVFPAEDIVLRNMNLFLQRLQVSPKIQVYLHICNSPQTAISQINFFEANAIDVVLVDLSQFIVPACYYLTRQAFEPNMGLYNPLVFPAIDTYFKRLIDQGLQIVSQCNKVIRETVLVLLIPSVEERFSNLEMFRQSYERVIQILQDSTFEYEVFTFTDNVFFGEQCEMQVESLPGFLSAELKQSIEAETLRRYFYGTDEKLTPKSIDISRSKVEFLEVRFDEFVEVADCEEFKYGFIKNPDGNEALALIKIQQITNEVVEMVVCTKEVLDWPLIQVLVSSVDIV